MNTEIKKALPRFLEILGLDEEPMGIFYTDEKPAEGFSPKPTDLPTREKELENAINWQAVFGEFSCVIGNIWRARKKKIAAYFDSASGGPARKKLPPTSTPNTSDVQAALSSLASLSPRLNLSYITFLPAFPNVCRVNCTVTRLTN